MKLTKKYLTQLIKEELENAMSEEAQDDLAGDDEMTPKDMLLKAWQTMKKAEAALERAQANQKKAQSDFSRNMPGYQGRGYDHYAGYTRHMADESLDAAQRLADAANIAFKNLKIQFKEIFKEMKSGK